MKFQFPLKKYLKNLKKPIDKTFKIHYNMLVSYRDTSKTCGCDGIAADEQYRLEREQNKQHEHPLVDWGWNEAKALSFCYDKGFDWEGLYEHFSRVSCWCCPLQPLEELRKLRRYYPELWQELIEMDRATWRKFKPEFSVDELEIRFALEDERTAQGLTINGHSKEFRQALKERLQKQQNFLR